ncbi:MAG TPA: anthrone oxygenase family protein [Acidobacteriaceae bacterium]|jgi:hypothetical protein|nr:anthrone oxygenase family protein [Acidobacteriaceae bacterium]
MRFLDILAIVSLGLMIGVEFAVSAFINPTLLKLDDEPQAKSLGLFGALLGSVMPFWYSLCLLLLIAEAILRRNTPALTPLILAASLWTFVILFTLAVLVPLNNRIVKFQPTALPAGWQHAHRRWDNLHRLRVALLLLAYVLALNAILTTSAP